MKTDIAALVHFKSPDRNQFLIALDCHRLDEEGSQLFGNGETKGLLYWLGNGTLLLKDVDEVSIGFRL
jgi:transcriptional regulator with AAA-type ATPase domain